MKAIRNFFLFFFIVIYWASFAQVSIGTNTPNASSMLDVTSTTKGFLPPRMTYAQISSIPSPAAGLVVYCTDCNSNAGCLITYQNTKWECLGGSGALLPAPVAGAATLASCGGFTANWSAVTGATGYYLDVSTTTDFSSFVSGYSNLNTGNVLSQKLAGLSSSSTYYYRVRAYNTSVTSSNSNTITATTTSQPVAPVAAAAVNIGCTGFNACWGSVAGATSYMLDVSTASNFSTFLQSYNNLDVGPVTSARVAPTSASANYYYRVRAMFSCGTSGNSNTITATTTGSVSAPTANTVTNPGCTGFTATWSAVSGATGYTLDISTVSTFVSFVEGYNNRTTGNVTSYSITGLGNGITYYWRVKATGNCGTSTASNTVTTSTLTVPAAPTAVAASNTYCTGFTSNWTVSSGAASYVLDVSTASNFDSFIPGYQNLNVGNVNSYSVTGLSETTTYYYRVCAINACVITPSYSNAITVVTGPSPAPVAAAANNIVCTGFTANWAASSGAASYRLDVSTVGTFSTFVSGYQDLNVGNVTAYAVSGLSMNTGYYYRIRAVNPCGTSSNSGTINVTTLNMPSAPVAASATNVTCTGFTANWAAASSATSYRLDVSTVSSFSSFVSGYQDLNVGNVTAYAVSGLSMNTGYYYRIRTVNPCGTSSNSGTINVTTLNVPSAPVATAATAVTYFSFTANWNAVSGATDYLFDLSTSSTFSSFVGGYNGYSTGNVTSLAVSGLNQGVTYYYRLKASGSCGSSASFSNSIIVTTPQIMQTMCGETFYYSTVSAAGYTWLDRNLGASRVAQSKEDYLAYGMHYQWGRQNDGHQCISWSSSTSGTYTNGTTSVQCSNGTCSNALFVIRTVEPNDWNTPTSNVLWNGTTKGTNDPCPSGYRVPTMNELYDWENSLANDDADGAYASPLRITVAGHRTYNYGDLVLASEEGNYWSSTYGDANIAFIFYVETIGMNTSGTAQRTWGFSVRCIAQ